MDVQRTGRIFGWLFIGTFVTSIPARLLFVNGLGASWSDMRFVPGDTSINSLKLGAVLEFGLIVTQIGTAVVIYPLVRRQSETVSLGYVTARTMESVFAAIGLISIISVVNVADSLASATGADATALAVQGDSLVNTYEWAFQWGPGLVAGIGNGLMLGYLMYRSALVPPRMAMLGLIGGPVLILSFVLKLCDVYDDGSATCWPADTAGGRVGAVARHLLRVEGVQAGEPDRQTRNGDGLLTAESMVGGAEDAQPGRVEERDFGHIDREVAETGVRRRVEPLTQLPDAGDIRPVGTASSRAVPAPLVEGSPCGSGRRTRWIPKPRVRPSTPIRT